MRNTRRHPERRPDRWGVGLPVSVLALAAVLLLAGCSDEELLPPRPDAGPLFARVVAIGNSITAGFQSGGINDSTQRQSYAVLVAEAMGTEFDIPLLNPPGCPPPLINVFTGERVPEGVATDGSDCFLRARPIPVELNNVAVPGAEVLDVLTNFDPASNPNPLTTFLLGGRSQLEAAAEVQPTFAMVWIGNNDVLGAALNGNAQLITAPADFDTRYRIMADSLVSIGVEGAALIGVVDVTVIPFLSPGVAYWQAEMQGAFPPTFDVADNCGPAVLGGSGESTLVPFGYAFGVLLAAATDPQNPQFVVLDCVNDDPVLVASEIAQISAAVQAYNQTVESVADENGWAFFDPNPPLLALRAQGEIPLFPNTDGVEAVQEPFGPILSKDGVHPSALAHRVVADSLIQAINAQFGTQIPSLTP